MVQFYLVRGLFLYKNRMKYCTSFHITASNATFGKTEKVKGKIKLVVQNYQANLRLTVFVEQVL